jgi:hypothetical protein
VLITANGLTGADIDVAETVDPTPGKDQGPHEPSRRAFPAERRYRPGRAASSTADARPFALASVVSCSGWSAVSTTDPACPPRPSRDSGAPIGVRCARTPGSSWLPQRRTSPRQPPVGQVVAVGEGSEER